jgi:hypothetical protein
LRTVSPCCTSSPPPGKKKNPNIGFLSGKKTEKFISRSNYEHAVSSLPISRKIMAIPKIYAKESGCHVRDQ